MPKSLISKILPTAPFTPVGVSDQWNSGILELSRQSSILIGHWLHSYAYWCKRRSREDFRYHRKYLKSAIYTPFKWSEKSLQDKPLKSIMRKSILQRAEIKSKKTLKYFQTMNIIVDGYINYRASWSFSARFLAKKFR